MNWGFSHNLKLNDIVVLLKLKGCAVYFKCTSTILVLVPPRKKFTHFTKKNRLVTYYSLTNKVIYFK